ncbi:MAG: hypothetical protein LUH48_06520 [Clostridiales bacterium]|nr:hypothetical protein [Clostridiales bacterium]
MSGRRVRRSGGKSSGGGCSRAPLIVLVILLLAALVAVGFWFWARSGTDETADPEATDQTAETGEADDAAGTEESTLPEIEETSSLTLSSVYTSSILNPDCGDEYAEEIASLEVTNGSDSYLVSATLTATMSDGTEVHFEVSDLPAGATAEIFDTENQTLASGVTCTSLVCTSEEYIEEDVLLSDTIEVTASGSDAVITNIGEDDLTGLTVVYHCDMAGQYFGGTSYTTTIDSLAAGESYTLSDSALMGEVAVVRIDQ